MERGSEMLELMNPSALAVGEERRRELALHSMRTINSERLGLRQAAGIAVVGFGRRLAGVRPAAAPGLKTTGDCV